MMQTNAEDAVLQCYPTDLHNGIPVHYNTCAYIGTLALK